MNGWYWFSEGFFISEFIEVEFDRFICKNDIVELTIKNLSETDIEETKFVTYIKTEAQKSAEEIFGPSIVETDTGSDLPFEI